MSLSAFVALSAAAAVLLAFIAYTITRSERPRRGRHRAGPALSTAQLIDVLRPPTAPRPLGELLPWSALEDLIPTVVLPSLVLPAPAGDPALTGRCCEMHNEHCEPPSELCCQDCTEATHDTFPIRHADGTSCVLKDPALTGREVA